VWRAERIDISAVAKRLEVRSRVPLGHAVGRAYVTDRLEGSGAVLHSHRIQVS
jgi:hypothetical protein